MQIAFKIPRDPRGPVAINTEHRFNVLIPDAEQIKTEQLLFGAEVMDDA